MSTCPNCGAECVKMYCSDYCRKSNWQKVNREKARQYMQASRERRAEQYQPREGWREAILAKRDPVTLRYGY